MNTINSLSSGQIKDLQTQDHSNLLSQLEQRVNQTLSLKNNVSSGVGQPVDKINPQDVVNFMAQISNQPMPGMNHSILI